MSFCRWTGIAQLAGLIALAPLSSLLPSLLPSLLLSLLSSAICAVPAFAEAANAVVVEKDVSVRVDDLQSMGVTTQAMNDFVYRIDGEGAFFLINTSEGSVLVDTGTSYEQNEEQMRRVRELATGPIKKIIVTHAHADHSGGLPRFKKQIDSGEIEYVAHHRYGYMGKLQDELLPYFGDGTSSRKVA